MWPHKLFMEVIEQKIVKFLSLKEGGRMETNLLIFELQDSHNRVLIDLALKRLRESGKIADEEKFTVLLLPTSD
jgi:hypothetical protein